MLTNLGVFKMERGENHARRHRMNPMENPIFAVAVYQYTDSRGVSFGIPVDWHITLGEDLEHFIKLATTSNVWKVEENIPTQKLIDLILNYNYNIHILFLLLQ